MAFKSSYILLIYEYQLIYIYINPLLQRKSEEIYQNLRRIIRRRSIASITISRSVRKASIY